MRAGSIKNVDRFNAVVINGIAEVTSNSYTHTCSMSQACSISHCIYPLEHNPTQTACIQHSCDCINLLIVITQFLMMMMMIIIIIIIITHEAWCEQRTLHDCSTEKTCCCVVNHRRTNSSQACIHTEKYGIAKVCQRASKV
jgi:hypothetical protein